VAIGPKVADAVAKGILFETDLPDLAAGIVDDRLAPKGYAYLLVHGGQATLATAIFRHFRDERHYFLKTLEAFQRLYPLQMKSPREFGGYGNFSIRPTEHRGRKLYVGEAAGFQDALFGFGMRYAMTSGYLAARAILEGKDYDLMWKREFRPLFRAAMVNRLLYELSGNRGYAWMLRRLARVPDVRDWMRQDYRPSMGKSLLYPLAALVGQYRMRYKDYSCSHEDCACVWCRCRREEGCL
jgi:flavin-dependent dehydrogenase